MMVEDVLKTKKEIQEKINEEKAQRKLLRDEIDNIELQTDKVEDTFKRTCRQSDALKQKLDVLEAENQALETEIDSAKIKQKAQSDYREQIKEQEHMKNNRSHRFADGKGRNS